MNAHKKLPLKVLELARELSILLGIKCVFSSHAEAEKWPRLHPISRFERRLVFKVHLWFLIKLLTLNVHYKIIVRGSFFQIE